MADQIANFDDDEAPNREVRPDSLRISWWNTRLSPWRGTRLEGEARDIVYGAVERLLASSDILCIGEVSTKDIGFIKEILNGSESLEVVDLSKSPASRHNFGIVIIYNRLSLNLLKTEYQTNISGFKENKTAVFCQFLRACGTIFDIFVVHWSSRIRVAENSSERDSYGSALRNRVESAMGSGQGNVVLIGDFNDEPFNTSMTTYLHGCRDASHVANSRHGLLYNPFWKSISCPIGYQIDGGAPTPTGTYRYRDDPLHKWRVFDQMLFARNFVSTGQWRLIEDETGVIRWPEIIEEIEKPDSKLDHLPITAKLVRVAQ